MAEIVSYQVDEKDGFLQNLKKKLQRFGWLRSFNMISLLLIIIGLPVILVFSSQRQTIRQKAASGTQLGTLQVAASGTTVTVNLPIADDDNNNAQAVVEYKKTTDTTWQAGPVMTRTSNSVQGASTESPSVPDTIIIKFKPEVPQEDRQALLAGHNLRVERNIQSTDRHLVTENVPRSTNIINRFFRAIIPTKTSKPILDMQSIKVKPSEKDKILQELQTNPDVAYAEPDLTGQSLFTPNDPRYPYQWDLPQINAPAAWDITKGSASVTVAVIDTGVDTTQEDLQGELVQGYDFVDNTSSMTDCYGHGTVVIGRVVAATNNGLGIAGLSPNVKVMPLRDADCSGIFTTTRLIQALNYASSQPGVKVINISQGLGSTVQSVQDAINYAASKGIVIVAAAGNTACTSCIQYPAAFPNVIAVGATTFSGGIWSSSSSGPQLDVVAPGAGVYTLKKSNVYGSATGTSFASPQVAALAALLVSANPSLTPQQVTNFILAGATDLGVAGRDDIYGFGRINALKSLLLALGITPIPTPTGSVLPTPTVLPTVTVTPIPTSTATLIPTTFATSTPLLLPTATLTPSPLVYTATLTGTLSNLVANTVYDIRVTVTDPDGIVGSNIVSGQITTSSDAIPTPSLQPTNTTLSTTTHPSTCTNYTNFGSVAWSSPNTAQVADNNYAVTALSNTSGILTSNALGCSGYGFAIPTGATVTGIKVSIERRRSNSSSGTPSAQDALVRILKGSIVSADRSTTTLYTGTDVIEDHGGSTDVWGLTLTPADVNASTFTVAYAAKGNVNVAVDAITVTVYYTQ